ncbi:hypothetical protein EYR38_001990 [Pleurotus pulmonarius]|nr:hypothetical protein EYR38_001990 [Pleurotus pulmonarius]
MLQPLTQSHEARSTARQQRHRHPDPILTIIFVSSSSERLQRNAKGRILTSMSAKNGEDGEENGNKTRAAAGTRTNAKRRKREGKTHTVDANAPVFHAPLGISGELVRPRVHALSSHVPFDAKFEATPWSRTQVFSRFSLATYNSPIQLPHFVRSCGVQMSTAWIDEAIHLKKTTEMSSSNAGGTDISEKESDQEMRLIESMLPRRPPSTLFETMKEFGLYDLPWIRPLECLEQNDFADRVLKVIDETSTELDVWATNPFQPDNTNAPLAVGLIATYVLLSGSSLDLASIGRNQCTPSPQVPGCIQIGGSSIDNFVKMYDWVSVVEKALTSVDSSKERPLPTPSDPLGDDQVANLYTLFHIAKEKASKSKITANMVLAALAVRYAIEGKEVPKDWSKVSLKDDELRSYKSAYSSVGPRVILVPLYQSLAISPILLLRTKDLTGKHVARYWLPIMWKHLGCDRPHIIRAVEAHIWNAVLQIARNPGAISNTMRDLFDSIKHETKWSGRIALEIAPDDRGFFRQLEPLFRPAVTPESTSGPSTSAAAGAQTTNPPPISTEAPLNPASSGAENGRNPPSVFRREPSAEMSPPPGQKPGQQEIQGLKGTPPRSDTLRREPSVGTSPPIRFNRGVASLGAQTGYSDVDLEDDAALDGHEGEDEEEDKGGKGGGGKRKRAPEDDGHEGEDEEDKGDKGRGGKRKRAPENYGQAPSTPSSRTHSSATTNKNDQARPPKKSVKSEGQTKPQYAERRHGIQRSNPSANTQQRKIRMSRLVGTCTTKRFQSSVTKLFDPFGHEQGIQPSFHSQDDLDAFNSLIKGISQTWGNSPPDYGNKEGSEDAMIEIINYNDYAQWQPSILGEKLKTKAILITTLPLELPLSFEDAIRDLNRFLDASIICHDNSIEMGPTGEERHRKTTLQEIIEVSKSPDVKAINCLDFPGPLPAETPLVFDDTLDRVSFSATWDMDRARETVNMADMTWTIAATPHTWHHLHVDTNGFGTTVVPSYGRKLWAVFRRKGDPGASRPIDWSNTMQGINADVLESEQYEVSYAILEPGTALMMPGGMPHMVVTLNDSTVFSGSHFYRGQCIRRHMYSLIVTAALPLTTNTSHDECAISIIRNVVDMFRKACLKPEVIPQTLLEHLPDVRTAEGMKDVLVLCVVGRILPVLFCKMTHKKEELNAISLNAAKLVRQISTSKRHHFTAAHGRPLDFFEDIYEVYLHQVLAVYIGLLKTKDEPYTTEEGEIARIPEGEGYLKVLTGLRGTCTRKKSLPKPSGGLSNPALDLDVDYNGGFAFVLKDL